MTSPASTAAGDEGGDGVPADRSQERARGCGPGPWLDYGEPLEDCSRTIALWHDQPLCEPLLQALKNDLSIRYIRPLIVQIKATSTLPVYEYLTLMRTTNKRSFQTSSTIPFADSSTILEAIHPANVKVYRALSGEAKRAFDDLTMVASLQDAIDIHLWSRQEVSVDAMVTAATSEVNHVWTFNTDRAVDYSAVGYTLDANGKETEVCMSPTDIDAAQRAHVFHEAITFLRDHHAQYCP